MNTKWFGAVLGTVATWSVFALILVACTGNDAREDLDKGDQINDDSVAVYGINAEGFPNLSHKCFDASNVNGQVVGFWTTTDRFVIIVYNDHACDGANVEQEMTVVNMGARTAVSGS